MIQTTSRAMCSPTLSTLWKTNHRLMLACPVGEYDRSLFVCQSPITVQTVSHSSTINIFVIVTVIPSVGVIVGVGVEFIIGVDC